MTPPVAVAHEVSLGGPPGSLTAFVALVPAIDGEGQCHQYALPPNSGARTLISYTMGTGSLKRGLSMQLDEAGKRVAFSDMRGELKRGSAAPSTVITLDFEKGTASASNESPAGLEVALGTLEGALSAENLGVPRKMIDLIEQRCMKQ